LDRIGVSRIAYRAPEAHSLEHPVERTVARQLEMRL
jgi:hypothetical protein